MAAPEGLLQQIQELNNQEKYQVVIDLLPDSKLEEYQDADLYAEAAQAYWRLDKKEFCKIATEKALALNSKHAKAYNYKGNLLSAEKEFDKAIEAYNKAIENNLKYANPYHGLGIIYRSLKRYDKAIDEYNKALEIDPKFVLAYNGLGIIYYESKQYEKAIAVFNKAIEIDPVFTYPYNWLGNVYNNLKEYDKAIEYFLKNIGLDPKAKYPYNGLGNAYNSLKQYDKAFEEYNKAIELDPEEPYPYNGLGNVYNNLQQYDKSIEYYNKSIELDPKFAIAHRNLGLVFNKLSRYNEAITAFTNALKEDETYAEAYYSRATTFYKNGQYEKALPDFIKYTELKKGDSDYSFTYSKEKIAEIEGILKDLPFKEISKTISGIKNLLQFTDGSITHYTSLTTLKILVLDKQKKVKTSYKQEHNIYAKQDETTLQPNKFRLSEGAYLNDPSEGQVLFDFLYDEIISNVQNRYRIPTLFAQKPFIGSFVAEQKHDDLTLWRMYGKEGKEEACGCAITLHKDEFIKLVTTSIVGEKDDKQTTVDNEFSFFRVAYLTFDENNKNAATCELPVKNSTNKKENDNEVTTLNGYIATLKTQVTAYIEEANKKRESTVENIKQKGLEDLKNLTEKLNTIAYLFKGIAYQYEHEVRLVLSGTAIPKIINTDGPRPKVQIELAPINPAIKKITLGPKVERPDEWASALYYALDKDLPDKKDKAEILISHLPYK